MEKIDAQITLYKFEQNADAISEIYRDIHYGDITADAATSLLIDLYEVSKIIITQLASLCKVSICSKFENDIIRKVCSVFRQNEDAAPNCFGFNDITNDERIRQNIRSIFSIKCEFLSWEKRLIANVQNELEWEYMIENDEKYRVIAEVDNKCKTVVEYISNYLSGTNRYDGRDYLGTDHTTQELKKRYNLLKNLIAEIEVMAKDIEEFDGYKAGSDLHLYPNIGYAYADYSKAKDEYELHQKSEIYTLDVNIEELQAAKEDTSQDIKSKLYQQLSKYIQGSTADIAHIIEYKQPRADVKLKWKGKKIDVFLLVDVLFFTVSDINKCLRFNGGNKLTASNRKNGNENTHLRNILTCLK